MTSVFARAFTRRFVTSTALHTPSTDGTTGAYRDGTDRTPGLLSRFPWRWLLLVDLAGEVGHDPR